MRPLQVSWIVILMLLLFGAFVFFESGKFILPLGIYRPLFTVAVIIEFFLEKRSRKRMLPLFIGVVFLLFTSRFVMELFLGELSLYDYFESGIADWAMLLFLTSFLIWTLVEFANVRTRPLSWLFVAGNFGFIALLLTNAEEFVAIPLLLSAAAFYRNEEKEHVFAVSVLLFFLVGSATITGMIYGKMAIMANL